MPGGGLIFAAILIGWAVFLLPQWLRRDAEVDLDDADLDWWGLGDRDGDRAREREADRDGDPDLDSDRDDDGDGRVLVSAAAPYRVDRGVERVAIPRPAGSGHRVLGPHPHPERVEEPSPSTEASMPTDQSSGGTVSGRRPVGAQVRPTGATRPANTIRPTRTVRPASTVPPGSGRPGGGRPDAPRRSSAPARRRRRLLVLLLVTTASAWLVPGLPRVGAVTAGLTLIGYVVLLLVHGRSAARARRAARQAGRPDGAGRPAEAGERAPGAGAVARHAGAGRRQSPAGTRRADAVPDAESRVRHSMTPAHSALPAPSVEATLASSRSGAGPGTSGAAGEGTRPVAATANAAGPLAGKGAGGPSQGEEPVAENGADTAGPQGQPDGDSWTSGMAAAGSGLRGGDQRAQAVWLPVSVPLPTYLTAPKARRTIRSIDLSAPGSWSSGRLDEQEARALAEAARSAEGPADAPAPRRASGA